MNLPLQIEMSAAPEVEAGVAADFASVWHLPHTFVIDFAATTRPAQRVDDENGPRLVMPARLTARVRIPPEQVFEIMKALEQQLSAWERETGRRPQEPQS